MATVHDTPKSIRRYAFTGSTDSDGLILGRAALAGASNFIANVASTDIIIGWELKADAANTDNVEFKQGPPAEVFAAADGTTLANYDYLKPGEAYSTPERHGVQEVDLDNTQDQSLHIRSSGATSVTFSGWVKVYRPET